ncbi:MAG TPA: hypothetical protein VH415_06135 [Nitrososphaeraceae archaeon]|jgi:hypothetical protein
MKSNHGLIIVILMVLTSVSLYPFSTLATENYTTDSTGLSINDSIRNLTNPIIKVEPNPLDNLSNPLAHPITNTTE